MARRVLFYLLIFQGIYYLLTALWPVVSLRSFLLFVGPKPDRFIFWTVDLLIIVIATTILFGTIKGDLGIASLLGLLTAAAFIVVEVAFYGKISPWFLVDFVLEIALFLGIAGALVFSRR